MLVIFVPFGCGGCYVNVQWRFGVTPPLLSFLMGWWGGMDTYLSLT